MTTPTPVPSDASPRPARADPRPAGRTPLFRNLAGGFLIGAGAGLAIELGTWPFAAPRNLDWSLVAAAGLILLGAGFLVRPAGRRGRATAAVSAAALILGSVTLAAAVTGGIAQSLGNLPGWTDGAWRTGAGEVRDSGATAVGPDVEEVRLVLDRGRLEIVEGGAPGLSFKARGDGRLTYVEEDGALVVTGRCPSSWLWFIDPGCATDVAVTVPAGAGVVVDHGFGAVALTGTTGPTSVDVGAADVVLARLAGPLDLGTGAGDVQGTGLSSRTAVVESGAGDLDLRFVDRPDHLEIATGAGDVEVRVPGGAYATEVDTGSGSENLTGITSDPAASSRIAVETGAGDVAIVGR